MENMTVLRENEVVQIPVSWIKPNPYQQRLFFNREALKNLAMSIKQYGVLQPICVRPLNKHSYEIIFGERRLKACKTIDMFYIPCIIADISDKDCAIISLIENIQGETLNFFEEARGILNIMNDYGCSVLEIAEITGKKEKYVVDKLELLKLDYEFRRLIIENNLSEEQARLFVKILNEDILEIVLRGVIEFGLNLKKTNELVNKVLQLTYMGNRVDKDDIYEIISKIEKSSGDQKFKVYVKDMRIFTNTICQAVETMNKTGVKTECRFSETEKELNIVIKVEKS